MEERKTERTFIMVKPDGVQRGNVPYGCFKLIQD
jgi:nucleoside diphosphate kinase